MRAILRKPQPAQAPFRGVTLCRVRRRRPVSDSETSISSLTFRSNSGTVASGMVTQTSRNAVSSWSQRSPFRTSNSG